MGTDVYFGRGTEAKFGDDELRIYHSKGTLDYSRITSTDTILMGAYGGSSSVFLYGSLSNSLQSNNNRLITAGGTEILETDTTTAYLKYSGNEKFKTTTDGVKITGGLQDEDGHVGAAGSILSSTGSALDWIPASSLGGSITINNNADNRLVTATGTANTLDAESDLTFDGTDLQFNTAGALKIKESDETSFNWSKGIQVGYDSGSIPILIFAYDNNGYISDRGDELRITSDSSPIRIRTLNYGGDPDSGTDMATFKPSGAVSLFYGTSVTASTKKFETTSDGVKITGKALITDTGGDVLTLESTVNTSRTTIKFNTDGNDWELGSRGSLGDPMNTFYIYDHTASKYRMVIDSSGDVGIGTTNPDAAVEVSNTKKLAVGIVTANEYYGEFKGTIDSSVTVSSDKITEGNTSAEVIDTGSDGRFIVTTEGSERLRINETGISTFTGSLTVKALNIDTEGAGDGDLLTSGGADGIFGIFNTTNSGKVVFPIKDSGGSYNLSLIHI